MKVIIYRADHDTPFAEFFKPIGNFDKVFFSNTKPFDVEQVKVLLPDEEDDSIFVVPESWKTEFNKLLEDKLDKKIAWQEDSSPQKPPTEEIGYGWSVQLAKFYDEIQVVEIKESVLELPPQKPCNENTDLDNFKEALKSLVRETNPHKRNAMFRQLIEVIKQVLNQNPQCSEHINKLLKKYLVQQEEYLKIRDEFKRQF